MFGLPGRDSDGIWGSTAISGWVRGLGLPLALASREWKGYFEGHEIRVATRGLLRACLFVDGVCVDRRSPLFARRGEVPFLSARVASSAHRVTIVEVLPRALWARKIDVRVAGRSVRMDVAQAG